MAREYFNAYHSYLKSIDPLNDAERGRLFAALLEYSMTGIVPALNGNERFLFSTMQYDIDRDKPKYVSGPDHPNWKGGITAQNTAERNSAEYRDWRKAVLKRDHYTCQICGKRGGKLNAHHKKRFSKYKELRLSVDNGITLCETCHKSLHRKARSCRTE